MSTQIMNTEVKTNTKRILAVMHILAWIAFIGLMIQAGAILVSYGVSWANPAASKNLYKGVDLEAVRQFSFWHYTQSVSFMVALSVMKAFILFLIIKALSEVNLANPFTVEVAKKLELISWVLLGIWIVSVVNHAHANWLLKHEGILEQTWASDEYIFAAGLVFIISQIFKRGVEIQSDSELTI